MTKESEVIRSVLEGNTESFRLLVERYAGPVTRMVRNITGDPSACEDLAQEVFLAAYSNLAAFDRRKSQFSTWLFTIAQNRAVNAAKKRRPVSFAQPPELIAPVGPGEAAAQREFLVALDQALLTLPLEQRTAFVLAEFEGFAYEEIARIERVRVGTVKSRINRAKTKLMKALERFGGDVT